ncbi:MAG: response regulator [Candidatus Nitrosomarinus sp.]|nr:MAG: response regulator [Candidatus Nitrosomarinus sp.]
MTVLIIDDNEAITNMLAKFFKLEGIECTVTNSGQSGLDMILNDDWENIILDLTMPEFSGYNVLEKLESENIEKMKNIIIFTATEIIDEEIEGWKDKGVKGVVRKPIELDYLLKIVKG